MCYMYNDHGPGVFSVSMFSRQEMPTGRFVSALCVWPSSLMVCSTEPGSMTYTMVSWSVGSAVCVCVCIVCVCVCLCMRVWCSVCV